MEANLPEDPTDTSEALAVVRARIDSVDRQIVGLIAEREKCVRDAGRLKSDPSQAAAPSRAARVVDAAVDVGLELGADPVVVRATYDAMVAAFIDQEARAIAERAQ